MEIECENIPVQLFWSILEQVAEGFVVLDNALNVMWCNGASERLLESSKKQLRAMKQLPFYDELSSSYFSKLALNLLSSPSGVEGLFLFRTQTSKVYLNVHISQLQLKEEFFVLKIVDPIIPMVDTANTCFGVSLGIVEMMNSKQLNCIALNQQCLNIAKLDKTTIADQDCAKVFRYDPDSANNIWPNLYLKSLESKKVILFPI
jgi:hypothetical protein